MVALNQPEGVSSRGRQAAMPVESVKDIVPPGRYRVFALPASHTLTDDVIISDVSGKPYLLSHDSPTPSPIARETLDLLGMAFEPSQDISWHTLTDLHRLIYGAGESTLP